VVITSATICRFTAGRNRFCQHVLERPKIQRLVGHDRPQPPVVLLELPAQLRYLKTAVLTAPGAECCVRDPVPSAQLSDLPAGFSLFHDRYRFMAVFPFRQTERQAWLVRKIRTFFRPRAIEPGKRV
jgi:hypothetical protein